MENIGKKKLLLTSYIEWYPQALFCNSVLCNILNANICIVKKSEREKQRKQILATELQVKVLFH